MKLRLSVICLVAASFHATAQQQPQYTQYILNNFIINPAVAGIENYWDVKASHRQQWVGLDGAPTTTYFTMHGPLSKSDYNRETATTIHPDGENPRGEAYWTDYTTPPPHGGVGVTVINDQTGPLNMFSASGTFSYHIGLSSRTNLSGGISLGMQQMRLNSSKLNFGAQAPIDPAVAGTGYLNKIRPQVAGGLWLYSADYFMGLSAQNIIPQGIGFDNGHVTGNSIVKYTGKLIPHIFFEAGYRMFLSDDISLLPSVLLRYVSPTPASFDLNVKWQYQDRFWLGGSYRHKDGLAAMAGINISSVINVGYAYDLTTSRLNAVSYGTHEIVVGFLLGNNFGDLCPRNIW
ncbi:PorP/SprF family type IX secretion system membrane protein [Deminuibacter soli]|uniref:Type IX secretion system membrane protein PorP/SprF n=1 Tax=Deminuibacter soli TaxID=2291815 RepID=A0A3E1NJL0_9BACT|nr:type IX secretion system membrane protein PorP/SprF [Deminuibacter soli]RFM28126.1 type IX secretion system membrane protein PorP/SprF [Deminuibacter soli]